MNIMKLCKQVAGVVFGFSNPSGGRAGGPGGCRVALAGVLLAVASTASHASACGAADHYWAVRTEPSPQLAPVLSRLALADHPDIALSNSPGSDAFDVALPFIGPKHLSFRLEGEEFKFILPPEVTVRESDITYWLRPGQQGFGPSASGTRMTRENEATMFRELTWQGWVRVPAWFQARSPVRLQSGQREMLATLVLQGTGNGCMQETDFVKWVFWLGEFRVAGPVRVRP